MTLLVVGSLGLDRIETPYGTAEEELGGSASYFAFAASHFSPVRLVGVVGEDFPEAHLSRFAARPIDLAGLHRAPGATFRWHGAYEGRMDQAQTIDVQLNVLGEIVPAVPEEFADSRYVFLANGPPEMQMEVLDRVAEPRFVVADTMNYYIENSRDALRALMERIDGLILNDQEALMLSGEDSLLNAARWVCDNGPAWCIVKKGEHGSLLRGPAGTFVLPGFPHESVVDPTGAGDSFAGGLMGYVAAEDSLEPQVLRMGLAYGTVAASFAIERFGLHGLEGLTRASVEERLEEFVEATHLFGR
jgi:sugar/nucleoside kinase (ribokinase family)